jgi:phosphate starvation-inducible membrane PsiE
MLIFIFKKKKKNNFYLIIEECVFYFTYYECKNKIDENLEYWVEREKPKFAFRFVR